MYIVHARGGWFDLVFPVRAVRGVGLQPARRYRYRLRLTSLLLTILVFPVVWDWDMIFLGLDPTKRVLKLWLADGDANMI